MGYYLNSEIKFKIKEITFILGSWSRMSSYIRYFSVLIFFVSCTENKIKHDLPIINANLTTQWTHQVNLNMPWPEYPRPQMKREKWMNLNGIWEYAITDKNNKKPEAWNGPIVVPFPIESALSGVKKVVGKDSLLWYQRSFTIPEDWKEKQIMLNFEAVDWECTVWLNGEKVGGHRGGYNPFQFNITSFLNSGENELIIKVNDPTDKGWQPVGKQVLEPGGIFYTSSTGIWQTVWLEPIEEVAFDKFYITTNIDSKETRIHTELIGSPEEMDSLVVKVYFKNEMIKESAVQLSHDLVFKLDDLQLWTPEHPNLYIIELTISRSGIVLDQVESYFGARKVSLEKESDGFSRIFLNNQFVFQNGPLDQGFWPDGLYTAPNEEAMKFDLIKTKEMGFNMLRKHVKIESRRFYYLCDQLGILVWQDMPNGDKKIGPDDEDFIRIQESAQQFEYELTQMIKSHYNHPSIVMWVPFNEGWGQYDTGRIVDFVRDLDSTRLVNNASGWTDRGFGDVLDLHTYPNPRTPKINTSRALVLGEFGGINLKIEGHTWGQENWGYATLNTSEELLAKYEEYYTTIWGDVKNKGLSAVVYTQTTDVETETNGLITYDREKVKISADELAKINTNDYVPMPRIEAIGGLISIGEKVAISTFVNDVDIHYTLNGKDPTIDSPKYITPIKISKDVQLKATSFKGDKLSRVASTIFTTSILPKPKYSVLYSDKYHGGGVYGLVNKVKGSETFSDGNWQGFLEPELEVIIELEATTEIENISTNFLSQQSHWIFLPSQVTFETSLDGDNFTPYGAYTFKEIHNQRPNGIETISIHKNEPIASKYIKLSVKNSGNLPEWHTGKGNMAWFFIDEIEIN